LTGVTWQFSVTPCFLSDSAIEEQGHRKIRSRGKVFLKFPTRPHQLSVNNKKFCSFFCCYYFIFQIRVLSSRLEESENSDTKYSYCCVILIDLFIGWASFSQGQHCDIFMDNVDMVYMNIMICWNIIMVMCTYISGLPLSPRRGRTICTIWQTKQSIKVYCLLFVYFYTVPNSLG
jgi:hypothetical protein